MAFGRNIQNALEYIYMLQLSCRFAWFITLSSLKLHNENNACMFILLRGSVVRNFGHFQ